MHNWHNEFMAEYHRQDILKEAEQIRLERIALKSRVYRPGFYARTMFSVANWMISTGKQLRKRYEVPTVDCSKKTTRIFAQLSPSLGKH
jgi:elongation factor P hydroxylase